MKTLATMVLALGLAFSASACKKDEAKKDDKSVKKTDEKKTDEKKPDEKKPDEAKPDETKPADNSGGGGAATGIQECDDYAAALKKLGDCAKIPDASKQAMAQGADAVKQSVDAWKQAGSPEAAKAGLQQGCKAGADAIAQTLSSVGC